MGSVTGPLADRMESHADGYRRGVEDAMRVARQLAEWMPGKNKRLALEQLERQRKRLLGEGDREQDNRAH